MPEQVAYLQARLCDAHREVARQQRDDGRGTPGERAHRIRATARSCRTGTGCDGTPRQRPMDRRTMAGRTR